ncbi:2-amino-4-hydroxy-6-hydroxymethyldihydropteridine diphosphokinase [Paenibacillus sp.]|uniref:2-amino-4-hydroxy-6- hydroxymethyldihydropteridine diphosphokinase n=1 Tax=Paenibacillus sp. TaxID=58172 RepID=UPI0028121EB0|nr:2-amino-4-hydroxy-6-hydroxymethyldihydropteridine diphosphokinase [Paenibacillus sp.]
MSVAYLGLGSNIGDRDVLLAQAIERLNGHPSIRVTDVSALYETDPVGYEDQPPFLNMACRIETSLAPEALLASTLTIERELGRERTVRWGPRTIDIDLLLYDNTTLNTKDLTVPHPRLMERAFVLVPLLDILDNKERDWLSGPAEGSVDAAGVRRWTSNNWPAEFGRSES